MKKGIVNQNSRTRNRPGFPSWDMGLILKGTQVQIYDTFGNWTRIFLKPSKWILSAMIDIIGEELPTEPPVVPLGSLYLLREHSQLPVEEINYGSFGILKLYAEPAAQKPHSITLSNSWLEYIREINTTAGFQWIFEHNDTKFFGSHLDGEDYKIPTQGVFHKNYVRTTGDAVRDFHEVQGLGGYPPDSTKINYFTRPDLVHFCWCVGKDGKTIPPPCGQAFFPVINPAGMQGSNVAGHVQTKIWIPDRYLLKSV